MNSDQRAKLLDELLDGTISEADLLVIEAELTVNADARQEYYRRVQLQILLERESQDVSKDPSRIRGGRDQILGKTVQQDSQTIKNHASLKRTLAITATVSVGVLVASLLLAFFFLRTPDFENGVTLEDFRFTGPSASGFAVVRGQMDAQWKELNLEEGDLVPSQEIELLSGKANLELFSGVQLILDGNAQFRIDSAMQLTLVSGQVRAIVPEPAHGFTIKTESGDVVDLGTDFAVSVSSSGSNVQVMEGEVELHPINQSVKPIWTREPLRMTRTGEIETTDVAQITLPGLEQFEQQRRQRRSEGYQAWVNHTETLQQDPRLIAYYQLRSAAENPRVIKNLAAADVDRESDRASEGAVVSAEAVTNRWGKDNAAIDFSPLGSRVRIAVPGEHRGLTLSCWVKIDSLAHLYNALFLTDGHEDREPHWQIMEDGRMFFSIKIPEGRNVQEGKTKQQVFYSPSIWDLPKSGRWMMLSVSYDIQQKQVTHYLNGKPVSRETIPDAALIEAIRVGDGSIGNWSQPMYRTDPEFVLRNLHGSMDEFAIFSTALSDQEIETLFRTGGLVEPSSNDNQ